ncbi:uncharacterized protein LOC135224032 [Macrobrachium nipponense]|uniref:uncharacterized protein LOC135224032 n=1 Tax=Macrobrachium nipponense TaxID=159736 RepID=UPI0030C83AF2
MSATQLAYSLQLYEETCKDLCTSAADLIQRASDVESSTLETYRLRLESQIKKYEELNFKYLVQLGEEGFSEQDPDRAQLTAKRRHANQVIIQSTEVLEKLKIICMEAKPKSIATEFRPLHKVKLPSLSLPEFEGIDGEWSPFWDVFESNVHSRPDLRAVDKFNYLEGCLKGEALAMIKNILVANETI